MTDAISLSVNVDRLKRETARVERHQSPGYPLSAWINFSEFGLWGYDAAAFRKMAQALIDAAVLLETAKPASVAALDPSAADPGTPATRVNSSSS